MPSGIMQRFKGKIQATSFFLGGSPVYGAGAAVDYSTAGTQTLGLEGVSRIAASSGASVFTMAQPPFPGAEKHVYFQQISSAAFVKAASGASFDPSTNTVFKSTYAPMMVTLIGITTAKWGIKGVFPPPSTLVGGSGIALTTTT